MATKLNKVAWTEAAIAAILTPPPGKSRIHRFEGGTGLAIRAYDNGKKTFLYCYTSDELDARGMRIERRVSLDNLEWSKGGGTLAVARDKVRELAGKPLESNRQKIKRLRQEQQQSAKDITIAQLIPRYITEHAKPQKAEKSWKEDQSRLNRLVLPVWGERKVKDITRADVDAMVSPVAIGDPDNGIAPRPAEANHRLAVIRKMFSFAVDKGIIENHPCLRMRAPGGKIEPRDRTLKTQKELRLLWRITDTGSLWTKAKRDGWPRGTPWEARGRMSPAIADALRLVLYTGCRANEAAGLPWCEVDLDAGEWALPKERSKNKRANLIPLLPPVVEMLRERRELVTGEYVFPGHRASTEHVNDKHLSEALRYSCARLQRIGLAPFTTHDLRRTVETGMAAARVPKEYRDRVLNHVDASVGGKHYNLHDYIDEKREALEAWVSRLEAMLKPERDNVVPIRMAKR